MTVIELIKELENFHPDLEVYVKQSNGFLITVDKVDFVKDAVELS